MRASVDRIGRGLCTGPMLAVLAAVTCVCTGAWAAVTADPGSVTFNTPDQSQTVKLMNDGAPLPASEIQGYDLLVGDHTYEYMVSMEKHDGSVTIKPTDKLEVGSYRMVIHTTHGPVDVAVYSPLAEIESVLDKQAAALGIPVLELKERLGLTVPIRGGEKVTFTLAPVYYVGDKLLIETPCAADRSYEWRVNGKVVASGMGTAAAPLDYVFTTPGVNVVEYNESAKDRVLATGRASTNVVNHATAVSIQPVSPK